MLSLVLIYFVGKKFYTLAEKFDKNKWLFAILGVVSYYAGIILAGAMMGFLIGIFAPETNLDNPIGLGLLTIPFGMALTFLFYKILKPNWEEEYRRKLIIERNKTQVYNVPVINEEE